MLKRKPRCGFLWLCRPAGLLELLICMAWLAWPLAAGAQVTYPAKPIRFITPFAPGGSTTAMARLIGQKMTENWGHNVIVDNRHGGNTIIGTEALAKSTPDGYTILLTPNTHVIIPSLFPKLPYDPIRDFAPVGTPQPIIRKLSTEIVRILALPEVLDYLAKQGMAAFSSTPEQLAVLMKTDLARWAKVIKAANIKLEN